MTDREHICADGLFRVMQAAEFLAIGKTMVYELMDSGELPWIDVSEDGATRASRRIPRRACVEWAASRMPEDASDD